MILDPEAYSVSVFLVSLPALGTQQLDAMSTHSMRFGATEQHNEHEEGAHACTPQLELHSHPFLCTVRQVTCQFHAWSKDRNGALSNTQLAGFFLLLKVSAFEMSNDQTWIRWCCCPYVSSRHCWVPSLALISPGHLRLTHRSPCCCFSFSLLCLVPDRVMLHGSLEFR